ncbi:hypothetical protein GQ568_01200 [Patescibacteria group bacterium]|nr:hypothetical protein [Patescibacteria group bacterium]
MESVAFVKSAVGTLHKLGKLKECKEITNLMDDSIKDKEKIKELNEKNIYLEKENKKLSEKLEFKEDIEFKNNAYRKKSGGKELYCPGCWDKNKDQIIMHSTTSGSAICPVCKNEIIINGNSGKNEVVDNSDEPFNRFKVF